MAIQAFSPGDPVPASGTYWVSHSLHRVPHLAFLKRGEHFLACAWCGHRVIYEFADDSLSASPLAEDVDFRT